MSEKKETTVPAWASPSFLAGAATAFGGLLVLAEALLRLSVPTGFWYSHLDLSGDLTGLAELRDRLHYGVPAGDRLYLLGDSVLGASSLMEHRIPGARAKTLYRALRDDLRGTGRQALSLGSDGLLLPDILGLAREMEVRPSDRVLLLLNFRMFCKDFNGGDKALSRKFLMPDLPADLQARVQPSQAPAQETLLGDALYAWMADHWFLFRETQAAKVLWYYPGQKDLFQRQLEKLMGEDEGQADILEGALKQKVAPFYQPSVWDPTALPWTSLKRLLDEWAAKGSRVDVVLTPQNGAFLGPLFDKPSSERNRKSLAAFLGTYLGKGLTYRDWADRYPSSYFLDHCHLTPEGNAAYAHDLAAFLEGGAK